MSEKRLIIDALVEYMERLVERVHAGLMKPAEALVRGETALEFARKLGVESEDIPAKVRICMTAIIDTPNKKQDADRLLS